MNDLQLRTGELSTCRFIKPWLTVLDYEYVDEKDNGVIVRLGDGDKLVKLKMNTYIFDWVSLQYFMKNQFSNYYPYITTIGETERTVTGKMEHTYIYESYELHQYVINRIEQKEMFHTPLFNSAIDHFLKGINNGKVPNELSINWDKVLFEDMGDGYFLLGYPDPNDMLYYHNISDVDREMIKKEYLIDPEFRDFEEVIDENNKVHKREVDGLPKDPELVNKRYQVIQEVTWKKMGQRVRYDFFLFKVDEGGVLLAPQPLRSLRDLTGGHRDLIREVKHTILRFYRDKWDTNYEDVFIYLVHSLQTVRYRSVHGAIKFYGEKIHPYSFVEFFRKDSDRIHTIDHILNNLKYSDYYQQIPLRYNVKTQLLYMSGTFDPIMEFTSNQLGNKEYQRMHQSLVESSRSIDQTGAKVKINDPTINSNLGGMIDVRVPWIGDIRGEQRELRRGASQEFPRKRVKSRVKGRYMGCVRNYQPEKYKDYYYLLIREFNNLLTFIRESSRGYNKIISDRDERDYIKEKIDQFKESIQKKAGKLYSEGYYNVSDRIYYHPLVEGILRNRILGDIRVEILDMLEIKVDKVIENIDNLQVIDSDKHYKLLIKVNSMFSSNNNLISEETLHDRREYRNVEKFFVGQGDSGNEHFNRMRDLSQMGIENHWERKVIANCLAHLKNLLALSSINKRELDKFVLEELSVYKQLATIYWKYTLTNFVIRRFSRQSNKYVHVIGYFRGAPTDIWHFQFTPILIQRDFEELLKDMKFGKIINGVDGTKFYQANSNIFNYQISGRRIDPKNDANILKKYAYKLYVHIYENRDIHYRTYEKWLDKEKIIKENPSQYLTDYHYPFVSGIILEERKTKMKKPELIWSIYKHGLEEKFIHFSKNNTFFIIPDPKWVGFDGYGIKELKFNPNSPKTKEMMDKAYFVAFYLEPEVRQNVVAVHQLLKERKGELREEDIEMIKKMIPFKKFRPKEFPVSYRYIRNGALLNDIIDLVNQMIEKLGFSKSEFFTRGNFPHNIAWFHLHNRKRLSPFVSDAEWEATIDRMGKTFNTFSIIDNLKYDINYYANYEHVYIDIVRSITFLNNVTDYNFPDEYLPYAPYGVEDFIDIEHFKDIDGSPKPYVYKEPILI